MRTETGIDRPCTVRPSLDLLRRRHLAGLAHITVLCCGLAFSINGLALSIRDALGMIESGNDDRAVGRAGEISRYQIKKEIWRKHSASSTFWDHSEAWRVTEQVLVKRMNDFQTYTGRAPDPFDVYVLWNAPGQFRAVKYHRQRISRVVAERAARFANLVGESTPASFPPRSHGQELLLADHVSPRTLETPAFP